MRAYSVGVLDASRSRRRNQEQNKNLSTCNIVSSKELRRNSGRIAPVPKVSGELLLRVHRLTEPAIVADWRKRSDILMTTPPATVGGLKRPQPLPLGVLSLSDKVVPRQTLGGP